MEGLVEFLFAIILKSQIWRFTSGNFLRYISYFTRSLDFNYHIFSLAFIAAGIFTAGLGTFVLSKRGEVVKIFGLLMMLIAIWTIAYGFELASVSLDHMLFWIKIEYLGIAFIPSFWLLFILKYTGRDQFINPLTTSLLFFEPVLIYAMVITMNYHALYSRSVSMDTSGPFPLLQIVPGTFYIIHTIYFYCLLAWGIYLLIFRSGKIYKKYRQQSTIILLSAIFPWAFNLIYIIGFRPFDHIDLTPFAFSFTSLIIGIGLLKFGLFDLVPIAREKIIEAMEDGVLVLNASNFIVDLNRKMQEILGFDQNKIIGHPLELIFPSQHPIHEIAEESVDKALFEYKNPRTRYRETFQLSSHSLFERRNTPYSGKLIIFKDITEHIAANKKLELQARELQDINRLKDKLFSIIAHDLRGPLASLSEILKLGENEMLSEKELRAILPLLSKNLGQTSGLLENLLSWSRSQLQGEKIEPRVFDLRELVNEKIVLFEKNARNKGIEVQNLLVSKCLVFADLDMIQLVIRNLLSNAIKFSQSGDSVIISAYLEKEQCTISIKDTGIGINPANREKLFGLDTFSTPGTDKELGTGLGLPLCKEFVEKNGGKIWLNFAYTEGSEFIFTLPGGDVLSEHIKKANDAANQEVVNKTMRN